MMPQLDSSRFDEVRDYLKRASLAVDEAKFVMEAYPNVAVTRAYYALFYASHALLLAHGIDARSHEGVNSLIGTEFVRNGLLPREVVKDLTFLEVRRGKADYDPKMFFSIDEAREYLDRAIRSINIVENYLFEKLPGEFDNGRLNNNREPLR